MRRWRRPAPLICLVLAGCGGSQLSDTQLRAQAGRICTLAATETSRIATPSSPRGTEVFLRQGIAVLGPELADLRALRPPTAAARQYADSLQAFSGSLTQLASAIRDLRAGEDPVIALKTLQQRIGPLEQREDDAWQALAIGACAVH